jgi:hypothetical protein
MRQQRIDAQAYYGHPYVVEWARETVRKMCILRTVQASKGQNDMEIQPSNVVCQSS